VGDCVRREVTDEVFKARTYTRRKVPSSVNVPTLEGPVTGYARVAEGATWNQAGGKSGDLARAKTTKLVAGGPLYIVNWGEDTA
jgi:hypothetical protein